MFIGVKIKLYPTNHQKEFIDNNFSLCRSYYNHILYEYIKVYETYKAANKKISEHKYMTHKEYTSKYTKYKQADSSSLIYERKALGIAFRRFYKFPSCGYPKFKILKNLKKETYTTRGSIIRIVGNRLLLPKIREGIRFRGNIPSYDFRIVSVTVTKEKTNQYYASLSIEVDNSIFKKEENNKKAIIGFSLGCITINGKKDIPNIEIDKKYIEKMLYLHRKIEKRKNDEFSSNNKKDKMKYHKMKMHIDNIFKDYYRKLSSQLVNEYGSFVIEKSTSKMHPLSFSISYFNFIEELKKKCELHGRIYEIKK